MNRLINDQTTRISPTTHNRVSQIYAQLWNQAPTATSHRQRQSVNAARARGENSGWPPPMALDDTKIDDPAYNPSNTWKRWDASSSAVCAGHPC
jgi:hypothetical protein